MIHEIAHGMTALKLGDETAKLSGRLTLNPLKHIDPIGSILVPLLFYFSGGGFFGWAKPVPYNPRALYKDFRYGPMKVALAGPFSNLALAVVFGLAVRFAGSFMDPLTIALVAFIVQLNCLLFVFNLLPIPPLDGSKLLLLVLPRQYALRFEMMGFQGLILIILFLSLFSGFIYRISDALTMLLIGV